MILTFLFCFTTLIADIFYGEVGIRYLFNGRKHAVEPVIKIYQAIVFVLITIGAVLPLPVLWDLVDFCAAFLVLFNVFTLLSLMKYVKYVLDDYTAQAGKGTKPVWDDTVGIKERCK